VEALKRFYLVYVRVIDLPYDQKVLLNRHLLERDGSARTIPKP